MNDTKKDLEEGKKDFPRKKEELLAYSYNDNGHPIESGEKTEDRTPTLNDSISLISKDTGQDIIDAQGVDGHQLEVSNIHVHNAATLLERLNAAGRNENIPPEILKDLENRYLMTAIVDGKTVSKVLTEQQFDKAMSLDDYQRFRYFNIVFGIEPRNSVRVPDIQFSQRHTRDVNLTEKSSQDMTMDKPENNKLKDMTESAYSAIIEQDKANQSQEQSMGMSR